MLSYQYVDGAEGYYFDKIRINTFIEIDDLKKRCPVKKGTPDASSFLIREASDAARYCGFKSTIEMVAPSFRCLWRLAKALSPEVYRISYIEITRDTFYHEREGAQQACEDNLQLLRKKYTADHFIYDQRLVEDDKKDKEEPQPDDKLFSPVTGYFGKKGFQLVLYPRGSKINDSPVLHWEWRILGASLIRRKTGISDLKDLLKFDFVKFFETLEDRFVAYEEIDREKLGKWHKGWGRKKTFTPRQILLITLYADAFSHNYEIRTYADLAGFFMNMQKEIKSKKGRRTKWEKKILSVRNYGMFRKHVSL